MYSVNVQSHITSSKSNQDFRVAGQWADRDNSLRLYEKKRNPYHQKGSINFVIFGYRRSLVSAPFGPFLAELE
jgi:hypothetical protein